MKKAIIFGCGGTGKELSRMLFDASYDCVKFLDDVVQGQSVIGKFSDWKKYVGCDFFCGLGSYQTMKARKEFIELCHSESFPLFVSGFSYDRCDHIGLGSLLFPFSVISPDTNIGIFFLAYHHSIISHGCQIGSNVIVSNGAVISGNVTIGDNCYIGANATVLENVTIGDNSVIAAGAVVLDDVCEKTIYISKEKFKKNRYF